MSDVPEGYKKTEVGVIPGDWEVKKLGDLVDKFVNGGTPSTQVSDYWKGEIPWITGADILNQKVSVIRRYISREAVKNSSTNIIEKNTLLLVSRTGVGKLAIAPFDVAISQDFTGIYTKKSELDTGYLFRYLDFVQKELTKQNQGTSIQGITRETLASIPIPLPPTRAEQTAIATTLYDADALITQLEKLIAKKRNIKQGAMQELLKPKEGGEVKTLGDIAEIKDGTHQTPKYFDYGIPFYSVENVTANDFTNTKYISQKEHDFLTKNWKIEKGDILMTRIGSIGDCKYVDWDVNASFYVSLALLKVKKGYSAKFICQYSKCSFFKRELEMNSLLFAYPKKINLGQISKVKIVIPKPEEQIHISQILSDMDTEIEALIKKLEKYKALKQGMMQNLLTGKIRLTKENKA